MDPHPLTNAEAKALANSGLAVYLSPEYLNTRTALYERDTQLERWVCLQSGLRVAHCTSLAGQGRKWNMQTRCFEVCTCAKCTQ
jgi:hypothetical protein